MGRHGSDARLAAVRRDAAALGDPHAIIEKPSSLTTVNAKTATALLGNRNGQPQWAAPCLHQRLLGRPPEVLAEALPRFVAAVAAWPFDADPAACWRGTPG